MKRATAIALVAMAAVFALGMFASNAVTYTSEVSPIVPWQALGSITKAEATQAPNACSYATVWALPASESVKWDVPGDVEEVEFRFQSTGNADSHVVEMWVAASDYVSDGSSDVFTLGAILTLTGGPLVGTHTNFFIETIAVTASEGIFNTDDVVEDVTQDRYAIWRVKLRGYKKVVFIVTALQTSATLYAEARWF